jgi:hypothetical protein
MTIEALSLRGSRVSAVATLALVACSANPAFASATDEEAGRRLFLYLTKPVPNLRIVAQLETHEKPWSADQIQQVARKRLPQLPTTATSSERERYDKKLQDRIQRLRTTHSGSNVTRVCEWIAPGLYRVDELAVGGDLVTNSFKGDKNVKFSFANISDRNFSDAVSWTAFPPIRSATLTKVGSFHATHDLWQCLVAEPNLAFLFLAIVKQDGRKAGVVSGKAAENWPNGSFGTFRTNLDESKLSLLLAGANPKWSLSVSNQSLDGMDSVLLTIQSRDVPGMAVSYCMDWPGQNNMLKIVLKVPSENVLITSIRRYHDAYGVPREWTLERRTKDGVEYKKVTINEYDLDPKWDTKVIFAPVFSDLYTVEDVTAGTGQIVQLPKGMPRTVLNGSGSAGRWRSRTVVLAVLITITGLFMWWHLAMRKRGSSSAT